MDRDWTTVDYFAELGALALTLAVYIALPARPKATAHIATIATAAYYASLGWNAVLASTLLVNIGWRIWHRHAMASLRAALADGTAKTRYASTRRELSTNVTSFLMSPIAASCMLVGIVVFISDTVFEAIGLLPMDFAGMRPSIVRTWNASLADLFIRNYFVEVTVAWIVRVIKLSRVDTSWYFLFLRKFRSSYISITRTQIAPALGAYGSVVTLFDEVFRINRPRDPLGTFEPLSGYTLPPGKPDDKWEPIVSSAIEWADVVVIELTELSDAIKWELREAARLKPVTHVLLLTYFRIPIETAEEVVAAGLGEARVICFKSTRQFRDEFIAFMAGIEMLQRKTLAPGR